MNYAASSHIDAPPEAVWQVMTDPARIEAAGAARQIAMTPVAGHDRAWDMRLGLRGVQRRAGMQMDLGTPPRQFRVDAALLTERGAADARAVIDVTLEPIAAGTGTRLTLQVQLSAQTLAGRLLMQPLRFTRRSVEARLQGRVNELAAAVASVCTAG